MKTYIKNVMNDHEENNPHEKHLNDLAIKDLDSKERVHPAKPLIMHSAYALDGGVDRREHFQDNYDNIHTSDKEEIDTDILDIAEINAMLHHPDSILDPSMDEHISENRKLARDVLHHLVEKENEGNLQGVVKELLYRPLVNKLMETLMDRENILYQVLHPTMVKGTEHHPDHYGKILNHMLMQGVFESSKEKHWEQALPKIFKQLRGIA